MGEVTLVEITSANRKAALELSVAPEQLGFVGTVGDALAEAHDYPHAKPWYRAIHNGEQLVGFVMISWDVEPDPPEIIGPWFLWKLIVDQQHQGRGYGRLAVGLVANIVRGHGASQLLTSYVEGDGGPAGFYDRLGFHPTGDRDVNDEVIVALDLA